MALQYEGTCWEAFGPVVELQWILSGLDTGVQLLTGKERIGTLCTAACAAFAMPEAST